MFVFREGNGFSFLQEFLLLGEMSYICCVLKGCHLCASGYPDTPNASPITCQPTKHLPSSSWPGPDRNYNLSLHFPASTRTPHLCTPTESGLHPFWSWSGQLHSPSRVPSLTWVRRGTPALVVPAQPEHIPPGHFSTGSL